MYERAGAREARPSKPNDRFKGGGGVIVAASVGPKQPDESGRQRGETPAGVIGCEAVAVEQQLVQHFAGHHPRYLDLRRRPVVRRRYPKIKQS